MGFFYVLCLNVSVFNKVFCLLFFIVNFKVVSPITLEFFQTFRDFGTKMLLFLFSQNACEILRHVSFLEI